MTKELRMLSNQSSGLQHAVFLSHLLTNLKGEAGNNSLYEKTGCRSTALGCQDSPRSLKMSVGRQLSPHHK